MQGASRQSLAALRDRLEERVANLSVDLLQVGAELFSVVALLDREPALRRVLADPALPGQQKSQLARSLIGAQSAAATTELVEAAVGSRWSSVRDLIDAIELLGIQALLAAAERDGKLEEVEDELFRFSRVVDAEPELRVALADRALPIERRQALLDALLAERAYPATLALVQQLVSQPRGRTLDIGLEEFSRLAAERRQRLVAHVETAVPLDEVRRTRLEGALRAAYGRDVRLNIEVVAEVVGGIRVRVGEEVIDGTVAHRLAEAKRRLAG